MDSVSISQSVFFMVEEVLVMVLVVDVVKLRMLPELELVVVKVMMTI